MTLSVVTPAYNEAQNLPALYEQIVRTMEIVGVSWEWIVVDDHSEDETFAVVRRLAAADSRIRGIRLSRNTGSHLAISCGLRHATGQAVAMLAADLQDPPETVRVMLERWRAGAAVVWAVRRTRPGDRTHTRFSALYYWLMRHPVGMKEMPARGADCFLIDRVVVEALREFPERNVSVLALITWLGFRQEQIEYDKRPRAAGRSGWTLAKKIKLVIDSVTAFSDFPIRLCSLGGVTLMVAAVLVGVVGVALLPSLGAGILIVLAAVVGLAGLQLLALGVMGEYIWRALDEARRRPAYLVEAMTGGEPACAPVGPGGAV